ncbi:iron(III) transport system permease protein [Loktanella fryxellensis]|uniref:Iron(III) transport system permease protein n=1 Tax=Loktanella fryxellensis TaxID=245187 RepID=A0A1H7Z0H9_9RHOB|nr:iron ABC transporter permease [Loktanella fryxellensis]SEM51681.1 iron(III) transport system permease protein [Loktanella fryxellensis]
MDPWSAGAVLVAVVTIAPIVAVIWFALNPTENIWPHLLSTTLPRYMGNTLVMMLGTGALTAVVGTVTAWLVVMYRFPGRAWLQWALLMPLAVPAYVGAYALVDFLDYAGPVQTGLRATFGWADSRDYWFPQIRTRGAAILVIGAALTPYVYLLARAAFREQSGAGFEVARALGAGPVARFWRVGLPLARPAIVAGTAVVMMETVNDFGTVDYFAVQTLTTGIFSVWRQGGNLGGAAQIACVILAVIVMLVGLERATRRSARFAGSARNVRPVTPAQLSGPGAWVATAVCALPVLVGFVLPVAVLGSHALSAAQWTAPGLAQALVRTLVVCGTASAIAVLAGVFMVYGTRLSGHRLPKLLLPVSAIGYAAPGAVLALGILVPMAAFDNRLADLILAVTGTDPGLLLTGSAGVLVLAYVVRFFAISQGAADAALGRVPASLPMAARSLGRSPGAVLRAVHLPLIRASVGSALLLTFVDAVKELPATLMLYNRETLSTRVYAKASLENLAEAAPAALVICAVGLCAVLLLARANR